MVRTGHRPLHLSKLCAAAQRVLMTKRASAGHTLVELMIVVAMIAIVAALGIAKLSGRDDAVRLGQTALRIDGTDENHDGFDDRSGLQLTRFMPPASAGATGTWSYAYQGEPLKLPTGWRVATSTSDLAPIPPIPLGTLVTTISFTPEGKVGNQPPTAGSINPNVESPFPTVYFTNGSDAWAVAVHVTGPEVWQWDRTSNQWRGFGNRTVTGGS
jgi:prepilin-type N-terminal cleavage/methylation domain-containing protein